MRPTTGPNHVGSMAKEVSDPEQIRLPEEERAVGEYSAKASASRLLQRSLRGFCRARLQFPQPQSFSEERPVELKGIVDDLDHIK